MKKTLFVICFLHFIVFSSYAQWAQQTSGTTNWLNSVYFINCETGWTVGDAGTVLITKNGGLNWSPQVINTTDRINDVKFISSKTGWIAGNNGLLFKTINGGVNWNQLVPGTIKNLNKIYFLNSRTGWIAGDSGMILKTTNRGISWEFQSSSTLRTIYSIFFINSNTGWIAYNGGISKTTNGGLDWVAKNINAYSWRSVFFINELTGWVSGSVYSLFKTTDGGESWGKPASYCTAGDDGDSPPATYTSVFFINENSGWYTSSHSFGGRISKTYNGGMKWYTDFPTTKDEKFSSVFFYNSLSGWAVGENGTILHISLKDFVNTTDNNSTAEKFSLSQNYPNPFNPSTVIRFQIKDSRFVTLKVYDITGREIETLVNGKLNPGTYELKFDGSRLSSGIYFYTLTAGDFKETKKLFLLK